MNIANSSPKENIINIFVYFQLGLPLHLKSMFNYPSYLRASIGVTLWPGISFCGLGCSLFPHLFLLSQPSLMFQMKLGLSLRHF